MTAAVSQPIDEWDVVVIGGGPPGENAAQYATQASDLTSVIVEHALLGGECSYWACMPSKALLRPVELLAEARRVPGLGPAGRQPVDAPAVLEWRDRVVNHHDDASQARWAAGEGIAVVRGSGRLAGERRVEVVGAGGGPPRLLTARQAVVLATGSRAAMPSVDGLSGARPWSSRDVTNLHEVPRRVLVLGGGVVACEAATWLRGLGAEEVTVVERSERLLARHEPFAGELVADQLREAGVAVKLSTSAVAVRRPEVNEAGEGWRHGGEVTVICSDGSTLLADEIVVAAGRRPNSDDVGLESVGLDPAAPLAVDDHLGVVGVSGSWLYAVGDVCGRAQLTHMGKYQARICGAVIAARAAGEPLDAALLGPHRDAADDGMVPQVVFTSPPVGSVGITAEEAGRRAIAVEVVDYDLANLAGAHVLGERPVGRARLVLDAADDRLVGMTVVGDELAELVHSATIAIVARVPLGVLRHAVPSYPTLSEVWLRLIEELDRRRSAPRGHSDSRPAGGPRKFLALLVTGLPRARQVGSIVA